MISGEKYSKNGNMEYSIYSEPVVEPVTVGELKFFGKIDGVDEDSLLVGFIQSARICVEQYLRRSLITRTVRARMDYWAYETIELPLPPLISVTQIATVDEDGTEYEYDSDNYYLLTDAVPGKVVIKFGTSVPYNYDRDKGGIIIDYVAGYGTDRDDIPGPIRTGIMLWAMNIYENRVITEEPPPEAFATLNFFKVMRFM